MKKIVLGLTLVLASATANAGFFGNNSGEWKMGPAGPYWEESNWPQWTPMYWMEEMMDSFDNNNNFNPNMMTGYNYNNIPPNAAMAQPYNVQPMPYMQMPQPYMQQPMPSIAAPQAPAAPQLKAPVQK